MNAKELREYLNDSRKTMNSVLLPKYNNTSNILSSLNDFIDNIESRFKSDEHFNDTLIFGDFDEFANNLYESIHPYIDAAIKPYKDKLDERKAVDKMQFLSIENVELFSDHDVIYMNECVKNNDYKNALDTLLFQPSNNTISERRIQEFFDKYYNKTLPDSFYKDLDLTFDILNYKKCIDSDCCEYYRYKLIELLIENELL